MNIGLSYMTQIRGGDDTGQLVGDARDEQDQPDETKKPETSQKSLGGWIALTFNQLVASITTGYHREHNTDDTHGEIHCTSISEHSRTTPAGEWISVPVATDNFIGSGAMTISVDQSNPLFTYAYTLIGKTMTVSWVLLNFTVGGTPSTFLMLKIPGGFVAARGMGNAVGSFTDNGTVRAAVATVQPPLSTSQPYIFLFRTDGGAWSASAANSTTFGQVSFEVQ